MDRKCFLLESRGEIVYKADPDLHWTFRNRRKSKPYAKIPLHWSKIYFLTNSRVLISNMAILLQNCRPKTRNRGFLVLDLRFVFFWNITFCSNKFEGDFYQMLVLKYPNEAFLVPNLSIFILIQNFAS